MREDAPDSGSVGEDAAEQVVRGAGISPADIDDDREPHFLARPRGQTLAEGLTATPPDGNLSEDTGSRGLAAPRTLLLVERSLVVRLLRKSASRSADKPQEGAGGIAGAGI